MLQQIAEIPRRVGVQTYKHFRASPYRPIRRKPIHSQPMDLPEDGQERLVEAMTAELKRRGWPHPRLWAMVACHSGLEEAGSRFAVALGSAFYAARESLQNKEDGDAIWNSVPHSRKVA